MWSRLRGRNKLTEDTVNKEESTMNPTGPTPMNGPPLSAGPPMMTGPPTSIPGGPPTSGPGMYGGSALAGRYPQLSKRPAAPASRGAGGPGAFYNPDAFFGNQPKPTTPTAETEVDAPETMHDAASESREKQKIDEQLQEEEQPEDTRAEPEKHNAANTAVNKSNATHDNTHKPRQSYEDDASPKPNFQRKKNNEPPIHIQEDDTRLEPQVNQEQNYQQDEAAYQQEENYHDGQQQYYQQEEHYNEQYYQQEGYDEQSGQYYQQVSNDEQYYHQGSNDEQSGQYDQQDEATQQQLAYDEQSGQYYQQNESTQQYEGAYDEQHYQQNESTQQYEGDYDEQYYQQDESTQQYQQQDNGSPDMDVSGYERGYVTQSSGHYSQRDETSPEGIDENESMEIQSLEKPQENDASILPKPSLAPTLSQQFGDAPDSYQFSANIPQEAPAPSPLEQNYVSAALAPSPNERTLSQQFGADDKYGNIPQGRSSPFAAAVAAGPTSTSPASQQYATSIGFDQTPAYSEQPSASAFDTIPTDPPSSSPSSQQYASPEGFGHQFDANISADPPSSTPKEQFAATTFEAIRQIKPLSGSPSPREFASSTFAQTAPAAVSAREDSFTQHDDVPQQSTSGPFETPFAHSETPQVNDLNVGTLPVESQKEEQVSVTYPIENSAKDEFVKQPHDSNAIPIVAAPPPMMAPSVSHYEAPTSPPELSREARVPPSLSAPPTRTHFAYPFDKPLSIPTREEKVHPPKLMTSTGGPENSFSDAQGTDIQKQYEEAPAERPEPLISLPDNSMSGAGSDVHTPMVNGQTSINLQEPIVICECEVVGYGSGQQISHKPRTIATGICFLDHMIDQLQSHGLFEVHCVVSIDGVKCVPHTDYAGGSIQRRPRDSAIFSAAGESLGIALSHAVSVSSDVEATFSAPLDEALVQVRLLGGSIGSQQDPDDEDFDCDLAPYGDVPRGGRLWIGRYRTSLTPHFWKGIMRGWGLSRLVLSKRRGRNAHHIVEATFKAFARAVRAGTDDVNGYILSSDSLNGDSSTRCASKSRATRETSIDVAVALDGSPRGEISTGIAPYDNLLRHFVQGWASLDLSINCKGDTYIDDHHTVEDVAIVLGQTLDQALGDRRGCARMANATVRNVQVVVDLSGRPHLDWCLEFRDEWLDSDNMTMSTEMLEHIFLSLATHAKLTLHVHTIEDDLAVVSFPTRRARYRHEKNRLPSALQIATNAFSALGQALGAASNIDPRRRGAVASSKGSLDR